jgi:hypothetical protein
MSYLRYVSVVTVVIWRLFQIAVIVPSSGVGIALFLYALNGHSPVMEAVTTLYDWADTSVRPAPAGAVFVEECARPAESQDETAAAKTIKPVFSCNALVARAVPIDELAQSVRRTACNAYGVLLMFSFVIVFVAYPGKRFVGREETHVQPGHAASGDGHA